MVWKKKGRFFLDKKNENKSEKRINRKKLGTGTGTGTGTIIDPNKTGNM